MAKSKVLMLTFGLVGGSFIALKHLASIPSKKIEYIILGLGNYSTKHKKFRVYNIPFLSYVGHTGHLASKYVWLGVLMQIPLYLMTLFSTILLHPKIIVFNGLTTMLPLLPICKLLNIKIVLSFRSWWDRKRFRFIEGIMTNICQSIDLAYVNSQGTKENLTTIVPKNKIMVIEHHADEIYFKKVNRRKIRKNLGYQDKFIVLYVGRIDKEKHCQHMLEIAKQIINKRHIVFLFVGIGQLIDELNTVSAQYNHIKYLGLITNPQKLAKIYQAADVVFSNSDESYLARPAVEALAGGTPILIPSVPAMGEKIATGKAKVPLKLVPKKIGWIIDIKKYQQVVNLINKIKKLGLAAKKREECYLYAKKRYFTDPNQQLATKLEHML